MTNRPAEGAQGERPRVAHPHRPPPRRPRGRRTGAAGEEARPLMGAPPRFPHGQAVELRERGWTWRRIAESYGVTPSAVEQAVRRLTDPEYAQRQRDYHRQWQRENRRKPCKDCGTPIWDGGESRQRCVTCNGIHHRTTVRETTLRCCECYHWKPNEDFPHSERNRARRNRHVVCRGCQAFARQRSRKARRVPCRCCGKPRTNPADNSKRHPDSGLCRACWHEARREALTT